MQGVIGSVLVAVCLGVFTVAAAQLPPEVVADKYLVQAERLIAAERYGAALEVMDRIVALQREHDLALPEEFHFTYARAALSAGSIQTAMDSVNRYLSAAGREGEYYREALALLVKAEGRLLAPEMVEIRAGRFQMGCVSGRHCRDNEKPVHEVTIASFALSKYEVTFEEYDRFTDATGRKRAEDEGWGRGRRPVINVSWPDAVAYTEWLSAQAGERYRLPSEAEWEYAARAGSVTKYHFGDDESQLCRYANHADTSTDYDWRNTDCSDGVGKRTATVGSYQPNGFGLHDMHGNVVEWVQDCWNESYKVTPTDRGSSGRGSGDGQRGNESYQVAPTDGSAWTSGDCSSRVVRGGSWYFLLENLRAAFRFRFTSGDRIDIIGFRVARTLAP